MTAFMLVTATANCVAMLVSRSWGQGLAHAALFIVFTGLAAESMESR